MKRKTIFIFCILYFSIMLAGAKIIEVTPATARMTTMIVGGGAPAAGGATGCAGFGGNFCFDAETASEEPGPASGWTQGGTTPGWDQSTSGLDLEQDECIRLDPTEIIVHDPNYNAADLYFSFWYRINDLVEGNEILFYTQVSGYDRIVSIGITESGGNNYFNCIADGGSSVNGTTSVSANTTYKLKARAEVDSGSNDATITLWLWGGSSWTQECTVANGTRDGNIDNIALANGADTETMYFDLVKEDSSDITTPD